MRTPVYIRHKRSNHGESTTAFVVVERRQKEESKCHVLAGLGAISDTIVNRAGVPREPA
jgi:hypothetical protein